MGVIWKSKADSGFNSSHKINRFGNEGRIAFDHYVFQQRLIHSVSFPSTIGHVEHKHCGEYLV